MFKMLTAALLALSLALPGAAQAQQAKSNDKAVIGAVVGIAALAVIASQLSKKDKKAKHVEPPPPPRGGDPLFRPGPGPSHGPRPDRDWGHGGSDILPASCLTTVRDRRGDSHQILGKSCIRSEYRDARRLPDRCEISIKTKRGTQHGYGLSCLQREGYRIGRR